MDDHKLVRWLLLLLLLPLCLAMCSKEEFRYQCQDPTNWDKEICKLPLCDVNRTCPEHIFKGQRDPRLGPPNESAKTTNTPTSLKPISQGVNCVK